MPGGRRRKAVIIGCNYPGQQAELAGCINDAKCIEYMLRTKFGFDPIDVLMLTDDQHDHAKIPTKRNIVAAAQWLVGDAQPGDSFFFHFSGKGMVMLVW